MGVPPFFRKHPYVLSLRISDGTLLHGEFGENLTRSSKWRGQDSVGGYTNIFIKSKLSWKNSNATNLKQLKIIDMGVSENSGFFPPNHPFVHRVFHYFHHPFWGFPPIFGNIHIIYPPPPSSHHQGQLGPTGVLPQGSVDSWPQLPQKNTREKHQTPTSGKKHRKTTQLEKKLEDRRFVVEMEKNECLTVLQSGMLMQNRTSLLFWKNNVWSCWWKLIWLTPNSTKTYELVSTTRHHQENKIQRFLSVQLGFHQPRTSSSFWSEVVGILRPF